MKTQTTETHSEEHRTERQLRATTNEARREASEEAQKAAFWSMSSTWWWVGIIAILAIFFIMWLT